MTKQPDYKYNMKARFELLTAKDTKRARKELPEITGYNWKTIWYQWRLITMNEKRSVPSEPLDKIAKWFGVKADQLKNYKP